MQRGSLVYKNRIMAFKYITPESRRVIDNYYTHLESEDTSEKTMRGYFTQICLAIEGMKKPLEDMTIHDLEQHLVMAKNTLSPSSIRIRKICMRLLFRYMNPDHPISKISIRKSKQEREDLKQKHNQTLSRDELKTLMEYAQDNQTRVMFYFLYVSGCRVGELCGMSIKDVVFNGNGMKVRLCGKTGERFVPIYEPALVNDMKQFINDHPLRKDIDAPLWFGVHNRNHHGRIGPPAIRVRVYTAGKAAGMKKPVHPHLFRHARALELGEFMTDRAMMAYFGWQSADMCSVYCAHNKLDLSNQMAALAGVEPEKRVIREFESMAKECPRCCKKTTIGLAICPDCGCGLNKEAEEHEKIVVIGNAINELAKTDENLKNALDLALKSRGF